ncbi:MAG: sigma-70 family RNA polymerase sigma factor [Romboutsia sp.]
MLIYLSMLDTDEDKYKFENLYNKYKQIMFYVANQVLKDEYMSEDAVHLAFIRIAKNTNKIDSIDCPRTKSFIVIIVKRIAIDLYRKKQRESSISFEEYHSINDPKLTYDLPDCDDNIVITAINQLPEIYKEILILKFRHEFSSKEISQILDISKDNADKRFHRAKKKLHSLLIDMEVLEVERC